MKSNIRKLRKEKEMSQTELAEVIGKTQQSVSHMEKDRNRIPIESLIAMSEYFGVSTDYILGINDSDHSEPSIKNERDQNIQTDHVDESDILKNMVKPGNVKLLYNLTLSMLLCFLEESLNSASEAQE